MSTALSILLVMFVVAILIPFYRLAKGPTVFDRLLSVGAIGAKAISLILLIGLLFGRLEMFIDIALAYAILNFITGIAIAEYFRLKGGQQ